MKLRCDVHLDNQSSKVILVSKPEEKLEHLALKLAGFVMFMPLGPVVEPSSDHPSLSGFDIRPDLMILNKSGEIDMWIECGFVTLHKMDKITRRFPRSRILVLKATLREAQRLRKDLESEVRHHQRVEIWSWPEGSFQEWKSNLAEKTEIFGEAKERSFNCVVNEKAYVSDLLSVYGS